MSARSIPQVCAGCGATSDREPMRNEGVYRPYWLCVNRDACGNRAAARQHAANEAIRRAIETEKAALRAEVAGVKAAVRAADEGKTRQ